MAHEIYYTSAPEGIKRGSSGFCTVGATESIPRALWERMESLSAYRHQFSGSDSGGGAGRNPASWAHWLLNVAGSSYHVLSHVCDSGVDHTQRTNAFAHHVVLEPSEMAAAGPAWMLSQPGVMKDRWDGRVGAIVRAAGLPRGSGWDEGPAVCARWAGLTGDAGWGGVLAEGAVKSPGRAVCLLFSAGQEILPLLGEALRLLPAASRWGVTFNTYFTSMPTSATCLWRCCLKGTPAADVALRYASGGGGIVLDLTDPSSLGMAGDSEYVALARTGELTPAARLARATRAAKPVVTARAPVAPQRWPAPAAPPAAPPPPSAASSAALPPPPAAPAAAALTEEIPLVELELAEVRPAPSLAPPPVLGPAQPLPPQPSSRYTPPPAAAVMPNYARAVQVEPPRRVVSIRQADAALRATEHVETTEADVHRKRLLWLYLGALGAIGLGMLLVWLAFKASVPEELPSPVPRTTRPETAAPTVPVPMTATEVAPAPPAVPPAQPVTPSVEHVVETTNPAPVAPPVVAVVRVVLAPKAIVLRDALERVTAGAGIRDKTQALAIPAADFADLKAIRGLSVSFPGSRDEYNYKQDSLSGTLSAVANDRPNRPGVALRWKSTGSLAKAEDVLIVSLDRKRPGLEVQWKTAVAMRQPELMALVYWVVQNSALVADLGEGKSQRIEFRAVETKVLALKDASSTLVLPGDVPREVVVTPKMPLPPGWTASWYTDWEVKDAALRTPENASQVLKFTRSTSTAAVDGWFLLTFRPGWSAVESTFAKRQAADEVELARYESELRVANAEIARIKKEFSRTDATLEGKKQDLEALVAAYKTAVAGYKDWSDLDVALDLPDGLRIATLRFRGGGK
jgi:hypothetical protein